MNYRIILLIVFLFTGSLLAVRTDVVQLINGDRITGEIIQLDRGMLTYKTDDAGTLDIKWSKVVRIQSTTWFEVESLSGTRFFGALNETDRDLQVRIVGAEDGTTLDLNGIVRIHRLEKSKWQRIEGNIGLGFSFAQSKKRTQWNLNAELAFRAENWFTSNRYNSNLTSDEETKTVTKNEFSNVSARNLRWERWMWLSLISLEQNSEFDLRLRTTFGTGPGHYIVQTNRMAWALAGGFSLGSERYTYPVEDVEPEPSSTGSNQTEFNSELFCLTQWDFFRYDSPKLDMSTRCILYPSLTEWGRVRLSLDVTFRFELIRDFFFGVTFTEAYDSTQKESGGLSNHDYYINLTFNYSFGK